MPLLTRLIAPFSERTKHYYLCFSGDTGYFVTCRWVGEDAEQGMCHGWRGDLFMKSSSHACLGHSARGLTFMNLILLSTLQVGYDDYLHFRDEKLQHREVK